MKVWDLHCDTLSELRYAEQAGRPKSFAQNDLMIDLTRMKQADYLLQCMACFVYLNPEREKDPLPTLLNEPMILREKGSGSLKTADKFLAGLGITEDSLTVAARVNDQEAIKNLVQSGLGVSLVSERAARSAVEEKRLLQFELPVESRRHLYLAYRRDYILQPHIKAFCRFVETSSQ